MDHVVPPSLLFDFRPRLLPCPGPSQKAKGRLLTLPDANIFQPSVINEQPQFATLQLGWNAEGFGGAVTVAGKSSPPQGDLSKLDRSDSITIWLDTRASGIVHRATEYCHSFGLVPATEDNAEPEAVVVSIAQQRASRVDSNVRLFQLRTHTTADGYCLEFWIPGSQLHGFREISEFGRLGFHCVINDRELGEQSFGLADDFPTSYDPSTWTQLELQT